MQGQACAQINADGAAEIAGVIMDA